MCYLSEATFIHFYTKVGNDDTSPISIAYKKNFLTPITSFLYKTDTCEQKYTLNKLFYLIPFT